VYVDDLLITSSTQAQAEAVVDALRDKYKDLKLTTGTIHNYLGMVIDFSDPPYASINQVGMIEDIIRKARESPTLKIPTASPKSPATDRLFEVSPDSPSLTEKAQTHLHSLLASFNYVGGRARPDLRIL
jgi:hypothetical protein